MEVGCRIFIATSTIRLLKDLVIHGQALCQTINETDTLQNVAANCSGSVGKIPTEPQDARDMSLTMRHSGSKNTQFHQTTLLTLLLTS